MQDQWQPELYYHVIGKAIPGRELFREESDIIRFVRHILRFRLYHCFEILVYCTCVNHFHLAIRTRSVSGVRESLAGKPTRARNPSDELMLDGELDFASYVYRTLMGAISSYARWYNHKYGQSGQLFVRPTLHGLTTKGAPGELMSRRMCAYVGLNFVKHHLGTPGEKYFGSSLTNPLMGVIAHARLLDVFGGQRAYIEYHGSYLRRRGKTFRDFDEEEFYAEQRPRYYVRATDEWVEGSWHQHLK